MTNRYHLPVVVTTTDEFSREEAVDYVERILSNLEETDNVYRTYVEQSEMDEADAERLLDMLNRFNEDNLISALDTIEQLEEDG